MSGGYDKGYEVCPCFWGTDPGSLLKKLEHYTPLENTHILDIGCGEGKNAVYCHQKGAAVRALDVSHFAISNAKLNWKDIPIDWEVLDIRDAYIKRMYDVVIAYGLLHCMSTAFEIKSVTKKIKNATRQGGYVVLCAFNDRHQELETAHPDFDPCLIPHSAYVELFSDWHLLESSDSDLIETHPHNRIQHLHSMTRIIARKP